jgi:membrane-associated phospholipid phosphatase
MVAAFSFRFDGPVAQFFKEHHTPSLDKLARFCNKWGDWPWVTLFGMFGTLAAWLAGRRRLLQILLAMLLSCMISGVVVNATRFLTGRTRPGADVPQGFYGVVTEGGLFAHKNKYRSFPSAHTACAVGFTAVVLFAEWPAGVPILVLGLAVGCARLYSNAHHFSDVVVGAMLGIGTAWWSWRYLSRNPQAVDAMLRWRATLFG